MSYREYREESRPFDWWAAGLTFLFLIDVLVFGFTPSTLGIIAAVPFGYFLRKTWRIDEDEPPLAKPTKATRTLETSQTHVPS